MDNCAANSRDGADDKLSYSPVEQVEDIAFRLRFDLLRNALYHTDQLGYYASLNRFAKFLSVLTSTVAVGVLISKSSMLAIVATCAVAFFNTIDLVFNVVTRARTHESLRQRYFLMLSELEGSLPDMATISRIRKEMTKLYGEEPATKYGVDAIAWNQARLALSPGIDRNTQLIRVSRFKWFWRHILPFRPDDFPRPIR
jgi:ASC-1-like (ASCH) protein